MTMVPYDPTITRALRWMENKAPRITSVITQKDLWYQRYNIQFWQQWESQIFDLRTANPFGLAVWCIILGLPLDIFNFDPLTNAWAYGPQRGNYMDGDQTGPDFNTVGYNFQGGGDESVSLLTDVRYACQLRYVALVSNGRQQWINEMLAYILNDGEPWDMASGRYFYLTDATEDGGPVVDDMVMEYHIGPTLEVSAQFVNILNNPEYGILPQLSGVPYQVIQD